jgi:hypothetical protein
MLLAAGELGQLTRSRSDIRAPGYVSVRRGIPGYGGSFPPTHSFAGCGRFAGTIRIDTTLAKKAAGGDGARAQLFVGNTPQWTCVFAAGDTNPCTQTLTTGLQQVIGSTSR